MMSLRRAVISSWRASPCMCRVCSVCICSRTTCSLAFHSAWTLARSAYGKEAEKTGSGREFKWVHMVWYDVEHLWGHRLTYAWNQVTEKNIPVQQSRMEVHKRNKVERSIKSIERSSSVHHLCCREFVIQFTDSVSSSSEGRLALIQFVNEIVSSVLHTFHFLILSLQLPFDF